MYLHIFFARIISTSIYVLLILLKRSPIRNSAEQQGAYVWRMCAGDNPISKRFCRKERGLQSTAGRQNCRARQRK